MAVAEYALFATVAALLPLSLTIVLGNNFVTIDRLVSRFTDNFRDDKYRIKKALHEAGSKAARFDPSLIRKLLMVISKNGSTFQERLDDLEENVCICFASFNRSRSDLLRQILQHQAKQRRPTARS